jgi:probable phosphoglycerate mutase
VRHGHLDWLAPERFRGHAELPLADRGRPRTLDPLEKGRAEVLADEQTEALKRSLSTEQPYYLNPPVPTHAPQDLNEITPVLQTPSRLGMSSDGS